MSSYELRQIKAYVGSAAEWVEKIDSGDDIDTRLAYLANAIDSILMAIDVIVEDVLPRNEDDE